ncbi:MAG: ABC transporter permease [Actinobacteria bacterium]|nr:ABC transporter permease [Actinomycetota bacterium]
MSVAQRAFSRERRHLWDLITHLVAREFRLRYRQATLGWIWALASPLARLTVLTYLFTRVVPLGIDNYGVFVFTGLIAWQWFSSGLMSATTSAVDRRELLFRPGVPRVVVPIVSVLTDGLDYLVALPILIAFILLGDGLSLTALALPVVLLFQVLLTLGLGFMLCSANVYFRDVHLFVNVATLLGWYLTPVFYQARAVPESFHWVLQINPMAQLLTAYRAVLIDGRLPEPRSFSILATACVAIFFIGLSIYRRKSLLFVDEL